MAKLSPSAQAVLNALLEAKFGKEAVELGFPVMSVILGRELAAALRAAADQLGYGDGSGDPIINEYELLAIADELEAQ
jgi:hypothetical protein